MNDIKVSIIVPVYNVEKYIERCICSIIDQTYKNLEIIVVDDGTPDDSGKIIDRLALSDKRIKVIHKLNNGVSSARNDGLKASVGDYIFFVDGDDYLHKDCIQYYVNIINETDADVVCGLAHFTIWNGKQTEIIEYQKMSNVNAVTAIYLEKINVAVWNKIYSRKLIYENNIYFDESIWYGEGMLFNIEVLQRATNIYVSSKKLYYQTFNPDSAMRNFNLNSNLCGIRSLDIQKSKWIIQDSAISNAWDYHRWCFNFSIIKGLVKSRTIKDNRDLYVSCKKNIRLNIISVLKVDISLKKKIMHLLIYCAPKLTANIFYIKDLVGSKKSIKCHK